MIRKIIFSFVIALSLSTLNSNLFAETKKSDEDSAVDFVLENSNEKSETKEENVADSDNADENSDSDLNAESSKILFAFEEGIALARVTRIQEQDGVSNFVWKDSLVGAYFTVDVKNLLPFDLFARTEAFYPFLHTFNGMKVFAKQTILYAFDFLAGVPFRFDFFKYASLTLKPALHVMYQLSDEYHLFYFGAGGIAGVEILLAKRWTIILDGSFTLDYPNWGGNRLMLPFDWSWQWQTSLGIRYSKKLPNRFHLLP